MKLMPYSKYKDSGLEWLGEMPEGWRIGPMKHGYEVKLGKMLQTDISGPDDELVPYLRAANIQWGHIASVDVKLMWMSASDRRQLKLDRGDLLVSEGGDVGRSAIWRNELDECYIQNSVNRVRSKPDNITDFLYYWMVTIKEKGYVDVLCNKSTIAHFTAEKVATVPTPFPPLPEQQAIAAFLETQTARIDALIVEYEKLITLLKEKRQALISHAVTKGLNPDVPMKDSGVEWLGQVPEHWDICSLKRVITSITSGSRGWAEHYADDGDIFIRIGNLTRGSYKLNLSDLQFVRVPDDAEAQRAKVKSGDILFSITAYLGSVAVIDDSIGVAYVSQHVALVRPDGTKISPKWVGYVTLADCGQTYLSIQAYGGTKIQLGLDDVASIPLLLPPLPEQQAIAAYLDQNTTRMDALIQQAGTGIELLKERRTTLISDAVTGKIDVRGTLELSR